VIRFLALLLILTGAAPCAPVVEERIEFAGTRFRVVRIEPKRVQVVWKDPRGVPYRSFDRVQAAFSEQGKTVSFLMNAGIFEPGGIPCGLHIENRQILRPLNFKDAPGNFYLKPNGVVWIETNGANARAFVAQTKTFNHRADISSPTIEYAVQSGPMLLIDGLRHPAFKKGSPNKLHRNGVGVDLEGRIIFAITDRQETVNLWDFAGLFLQLGCSNALFLDGDISQAAVNPDQPVASNQFGAIFVVAD
jgi:uncharacterized protein YigE (DUF2233 family)